MDSPDLAACLGAVLLLAGRAFGRKALGLWRWYGWVGVAGAAGCLTALAAKAAPGWLIQPLLWTFAVPALAAALERRDGRLPFAEEARALLWAGWLSLFFWSGFEWWNLRHPVWSYLGWPVAEPLRYAALGWLHAAVLPLVLLLAALLGRGAKEADGDPHQPPVWEPHQAAA